MSLKEFRSRFITFLISTVVCITGYFAYRSLLMKSAERERNHDFSFVHDPDNPKWKALLRKPASMHQASKPTGLFHVEITPKIEQPLDQRLQDGDLLVLQGQVLTNADVSFATIRWLPVKGLEIVEGEASQTLSNLNANTPYDVFITVRKVGDTAGVIHFVIDADRSGIKLGATSSFITDELKPKESSENQDDSRLPAENSADEESKAKFLQ